MPHKIYAGAVKEFETALYEIRKYLEFVVMANKLRPWMGKLLNWQALVADQKSDVQSFLNNKDYRVEVGFNVLLVAISAASETLLRRLMRDGVTWINAKYDRYDKIPLALRQQNLIRSGLAIATVAEPPAEIAYDYDLLCKNIGTCRKDGGALVLNADAFSVGLSTISRQRIDGTLSKIGLAIDWDYFGREEAFVTHFSTRGVRKTADEVDSYLGEFVKIRNMIAHSGQGVRTSESQIRTALSFFEIFGPSLALAVEAELARTH